jgi:thymidylate synthase (FAD)
MKIIREPSIFVVGRQTIDDGELDSFLADHGVSWESDSEVAAEVLTETAGRTCYMSFAKPRPGGNAAYLAHIKESGHGSVLEGAVWNLVFTGVSRSLTHELIRHRAGTGFSQLSQRFVDESVAEYVEPDIIAEDPELHSRWVAAIGYAHGFYVDLAAMLYRKQLSRRFGPGMTVNTHSVAEMESHLNIEAKTECRKAARQAARSVLPNATETKIFVTANARALRHMIEQRGSRHAEPEIRKLANKLLDLLQTESANLFGDYTRTPLPDGTFEINTPYRKV